MYDDMDEVRPWRVELELKYDLLPIGKGRDADLLSGNWWTWSGSNRRPLPCHGSALPTAPQAHWNRNTPQSEFRVGEETISIFAHLPPIVKFTYDVF